ncbi:MAG: hypothetical protein KDK90_09365 [Leptospiraceae bacterium]|nr:hypothetical protein [Leptospiraceae bacterium]
MQVWFNIYASNHGKLDGVEDIFEILKVIINRCGYKVKITERLEQEAINIIVDEFTNIICNKEIIDFKVNFPNSKLYYVLTEFIEDKFLVKSNNFFGGLGNAAMIAVMNVYFRIYRKDFISPNLKDWLVLCLYFPIVLLYLTKYFLSKLLTKNSQKLSSKLHSLAYMKMRHLGLEQMFRFANGVILTHNMIGFGLRRFDVNILGTIHPEISNYELIKESLFKNKYLGIEITGSITPFRKKYIKKVDQSILLYALNHTIEFCKQITFSDNPSDFRAAYSLHPPQSKSWKYSSPMRIYRALSYDYSLPILTKFFNQHPIEALCLEYKKEKTLVEMHQFYQNPKLFFDEFDKKVIQYTEIAQKENDAIIGKMFKI